MTRAVQLSQLKPVLPVNVEAEGFEHSRITLYPQPWAQKQTVDFSLKDRTVRVVNHRLIEVPARAFKS